MSVDGVVEEVLVVCTECAYSEVVEKDGRKPAEKIVEHGRQTGHKLTTEEVSSTR